MRAAKHTQIQTASGFAYVCHRRILIHRVFQDPCPRKPQPGWGAQYQRDGSKILGNTVGGEPEAPPCVRAWPPHMGRQNPDTQFSTCCSATSFPKGASLVVFKPCRLQHCALPGAVGPLLPERNCKAAPVLLDIVVVTRTVRQCCGNSVP